MHSPFLSVLKKKSQRSISHGSSGFNGLMASCECLPKCCALQRVSIQSIVNAHSLAFWPEYVILMITAPLPRLDTMAHLKGICFLRSFFTGYTELYGLTTWPCVAVFLIRVVWWSVSLCTLHDFCFLAGCSAPVMAHQQQTKAEESKVTPWA